MREVIFGTLALANIVTAVLLVTEDAYSLAAPFLLMAVGWGLVNLLVKGKNTIR